MTRILRLPWLDKTDYKEFPNYDAKKILEIKKKNHENTYNISLRKLSKFEKKISVKYNLHYLVQIYIICDLS